MKTKFSFGIVFLTIALISYQGCNDKDEDENSVPGLKVTLHEPTDVNETSFVANWSVNKPGISSVKIELSLMDDFTGILKTIEVSDPSSTSQLVDGLNGATAYHHRINITLNDSTSGMSNVKSLFTSYYSENTNVTTADGLNIAGKICYLESNTAKMPGILLMGVGGLPNLWRNEATFYNLVALGYVCFVFDWRGQGQSDYFPKLQHIDSLQVYINNYHKKDLTACYTHFKNHPKVDSTKIALAGGSLGATMSLVGNAFHNIKASVSLSASRFGLILEAPLQNVLYIACEDDDSALGIDYSEDAEILYEHYTIEPKKLILGTGSAHGLDVLGQPGIKQEVVDWINTRFED